MGVQCNVQNLQSEHNCVLPPRSRSFREDPLVPVVSLSSRWPLHWFFIAQMHLPIFELYTTGITHHVLVCIWLLWFSIMVVRLTHTISSSFPWTYILIPPGGVLESARARSQGIRMFSLGRNGWFPGAVVPNHSLNGIGESEVVSDPCQWIVRF